MTPSISSVPFPTASCTVNTISLWITKSDFKATPICFKRPPGYPSQQTRAFAKPLGLLEVGRTLTEKKTMGSGVGGAAKSRRLRVKRWERQHEEDSDLLCGWLRDVKGGGCDRVRVRGILWLSMNKKQRQRTGEEKAGYQNYWFCRKTPWLRHLKATGIRV